MNVMAQQRKRNWKQLRAVSMRHAMELCVQHAREVKHLSVEQIADLMGEASHFTLYKWLESGRMPAIQIRAFEHACGTDFITRYLAHSAGHLLVKMPSGRKVEHRELNELNMATNAAINELYKFYAGDIEAEQVITALTTLLEDLAHQRGNVEKYRQPELLGGEA